jgi:hypothetical protein
MELVAEKNVTELYKRCNEEELVYNLTHGKKWTGKTPVPDPAASETAL